ncbi:DUF305 domain-containing protein [Streptomyces sp. NPDC088785]|uniref:DUF305 domain-containing protein n=1 Tax=Streptomyces sp. NPDC088785 TaxID=3365897 RepID=UPI0037FF7E58
MRRRTGWLVSAGAALAVTAGAVTYAAADGDGGPKDLKVPAAESADAGFARDMSVHHQQAVEMAYIVRDATRDEDVRRLAYDIAQTQANQRGMMLGWLDLWELPKVSEKGPMAWMGMADMPAGEDGALMPGMATDTQLGQLRGARGKSAEVMFLRLMIAHHRGGVHMAEGCVERCEVGAERRLARGMVAAQRSEIDLMTAMLKERGARP